MEVWVKVGELDATRIVVDHAAPLIDDVKTAIKLELKNRFSTVDSNQIIIRGSTAGNAIPSTMPLNDEAVTMLGSAKNPFILDDPRQGILES